MDTLLRIAVTNSIGAAAIVLLALVSALLLRRPALTHFLWLLVLVKLLTPPVFSIPVHLGTVGRETVAPSVSLTQPIASEDAQPRQFTADLPTGNVSTPSAARSQSRRTLWQRVQAVDFARPLFMAWIVGTVLWVLVATVRLRRFQRILGFADPAPPDAIERISSLANKLGIRRPPATLFIPAPVSPMLLGGLGRPRLLVPQRLWERLDDHQRDALLLHELAHMRRLDHIVRGVELLATVLYWWHPLMWLARRQLRIAEELCCDAWVTHAFPAARDDYAAALVEAIDFASASRPTLPLMASGVGEFKHLQRRLLMIRNGTSERKMGWTAGFALLAIGALPLTLTRAQQQEMRNSSNAAINDQQPDRPRGAQPGDGAASSEAEKKAAEPLDRACPDLNFKAVALSDVIDFMRDVTGANINVNWKQLEAQGVSRNTKINLTLTHSKASAALNAILEQASDQKHKLAYKVDDGIVNIVLAQIGASEPADKPAPKAADKQTQAQLDRTLPEISFEGVALSDVIDFMRDVSGANIVVNWKSLEAAGIDRNSPITLKVRNVKFSKVLSLILENATADPAKLTYKVDEGVISVYAPAAGPPKEQNVRQERAADPAAIDPKVQALLDKPMTIDFDQTPLGQAIDKLRDLSGANIFVNWKALELAGVSRTDPVTLRLRGAKLGKSITILLNAVRDGNIRMAFTVDGDVITISTQSELAKNTFTRVYDVRDILGGSKDLEREKKVSALLDFITDVDAGSWRETGGNVGAIRELQGQLIITQTPENQQKILDLLKDYRKTHGLVPTTQRDLPVLRSRPN
jgi:beta-lactamase regulating signal transducer with metallopeptidase domain